MWALGGGKTVEGSESSAPAASQPSTSQTVMRSRRIQGCPEGFPASMVIREAPIEGSGAKGRGPF